MLLDVVSLPQVLFSSKLVWLAAALAAAAILVAAILYRKK